MLDGVVSFDFSAISLLLVFCLYKVYDLFTKSTCVSRPHDLAGWLSFKNGLTVSALIFMKENEYCHL